MNGRREGKLIDDITFDVTRQTRDYTFLERSKDASDSFQPVSEEKQSSPGGSECPITLQQTFASRLDEVSLKNDEFTRSNFDYYGGHLFDMTDWRRDNG